MPHVSKGTRVNRKTKPQVLPAKFRAGFLTVLDKRTELARALRANYAAIVLDTGGPQDLSHLKSALIERAFWLEAILQDLEHGMATGTIDKAEALGRWIQAVNSLSGLCRVLGVERKARAMPWLAAPAPAPSGNGHSQPSPQPEPQEANQ